MKEKIYLDYNASTPIAPEVIQSMKPYFEEFFGNPSTTHWAAVQAKAAVESARLQVSTLLGCKANEVIFTSGGSESNNQVLKGVFHTFQPKGNHIITTKTEHPAIIEPCKYLEKAGAEITYLDVDQYGQVNPDDVRKVLTDKTILITIMLANNEVGTIQPIKEIVALAKEHDIFVHTDASQAVGKIPTNVNDLGVDFLTIAGHKLYAPKGVGALFIRDGIKIEPLIHGAGHESGRRAGTENVPYNVALGKACELAVVHLEKRDTKELRDYFWAELKESFGNRVVLNGHPTNTLPNTLSVCFTNIIGSDILSNIPQIAASTGSACHSGIVELSPVLAAMGVKEDIGKGAIRFSLGRYTTKDEIDRVVSLLSDKMS
jgi:cysteine desulfurase